MSTFKPPKNITFRNRNKKSVFLAGSIEMGNAENWQETLSISLINSGWVVFNPRRDDWDNSSTQEFETPQFYQQVTWELNALEQSDLIIMYFDPNTKSPISLLELGLYARSGKLVVVCPEGFWRKGNVDIVCNYYNIPQFQSILDLINHYL
jgi:nucleoside 2-deoxyribosyltransferase